MLVLILLQKLSAVMLLLEKKAPQKTLTEVIEIDEGDGEFKMVYCYYFLKCSVLLLCIMVSVCISLEYLIYPILGYLLINQQQ